MKIIQQTMIKNCLEQDRNFRWAGRMGLYIRAGASVIVEGAYPTACRNAQSRKTLEAALEQGIVELTLISNLPVVTPVGKAGAVPIPEAVQKANQMTVPTEEPTELVGPPEKDEAASTVTQERWTKVLQGEETSPAQPETRTLLGHEDVLDIAKPKALELFKDGEDPAINPEAYDPDAKRSSMAETLAAAEAADQVQQAATVHSGAPEETPAPVKKAKAAKKTKAKAPKAAGKTDEPGKKQSRRRKQKDTE